MINVSKVPRGWWRSDSGRQQVGEAVNTLISYIHPYRTQVKTKTSNTARASTSTVTDDPHLSVFALNPSTYYLVEGWVFCNANDATPDIKWTFQFSSAPQSSAYSVHAIDSTGATLQQDVGALTVTISASLTSASAAIHMAGFVWSHATDSASMDFQWAQNTSDASPTNVFAGSWMRLVEIQ